LGGNRGEKLEASAANSIKSEGEKGGEKGKDLPRLPEGKRGTVRESRGAEKIGLGREKDDEYFSCYHQERG